jgi:tRNA modification GTPase
VDTAGLHSAEEPVERKGVEVARRYLERADVVLFCSEAGRGLTAEEERFLEGLEAPVLHVLTKSDLSRSSSPPPPGGLVDARVSVLASIVSGEGLARLREELPALVFQGLACLPDDAPVLTRRRQKRAVATARDEVIAFADSLEEGIPAEVAATHLRPAETALEEMLGVIAPDEVLDRVFEQFCIGK